MIIAVAVSPQVADAIWKIVQPLLPSLLSAGSLVNSDTCEGVRN